MKNLWSQSLIGCLLLSLLVSCGVSVASNPNATSADSDNDSRRNSFEFIIKPKPPLREEQKVPVKILNLTTEGSNTSGRSSQNADEVTTDSFYTTEPFDGWTSAYLFDTQSQTTPAMWESTSMQGTTPSHANNVSHTITYEPTTPSHRIDHFTDHKVLLDSSSGLQEHETEESTTDIVSTKPVSMKTRDPFKFTILRRVVTTKPPPTTKFAATTTRKLLTLITLRAPLTTSTQFRSPKIVTTTSPRTQLRKPTEITPVRPAPFRTISPSRSSSPTKTYRNHLLSSYPKSQGVPPKFRSGNNFIIKSTTASTTSTIRISDVTTSLDDFTTTDKNNLTVIIGGGGLGKGVPVFPVQQTGFWERNWYWFLIGFLLIIVLYLIPGMLCQICLLKRCAKHRNRSFGGKPTILVKDIKRMCCLNTCSKSTSESAKSDSSSQSSGSASENGEQEVADSAESTQCHPSSVPEVDHQYESTQEMSTEVARSLSEDATVIVIPDPMESIRVHQHIGSAHDNGYHSSNVPECKHDCIRNVQEEPDINSSIHSASDIRLDIGNETIIKSNGVAQPPPKVQPIKSDQFELVIRTNELAQSNKPHHSEHRKSRKRKERLPHDVVAPSNRYRNEVNRAARKIPTKPPASRLDKGDRRSNTKRKLSKSTKSIIEAAKGLDEILEAITSLTHEYPIPDLSIQKSPDRVRKSFKEKSPTSVSDPRILTARKSKHRTKESGKREKGGDIMDRPDRSHKRRRKRKTKKPKTSEGDTKKSSERRKKIPTLVKEEPISQNKVKDERRRLRLERDLKKLQKYHNKHFQKPNES